MCVCVCVCVSVSQLDHEMAVSKVESKLRSREEEVEALKQQLNKAGETLRVLSVYTRRTRIAFRIAIVASSISHAVSSLVCMCVCVCVSQRLRQRVYRAAPTQSLHR